MATEPLAIPGHAPLADRGPASPARGAALASYILCITQGICLLALVLGAHRPLAHVAFTQCTPRPCPAVCRLQISMAMMGLYTVLIAAAIMRSNSKAAWEAANAPAPTKPDFRTQKVISGVPSLSEQPEEWEEFIAADEENMEKWLASLEEEAD